MSIKPVKGLRSYYPTDKGPIDAYQLGHDGRVEYIAAEIAVDHLNKGDDTTEEWQKWASERGVTSDEPGLVLSSRLGGSGTDKTNLFPKSPLLDKTIWKEHEQAAYEEASEMRKWKKIKFVARLDYPSDDSTRPSALEYQYDLPSGTILYGKVNNDAAGDSTPAQNEEEEEEEEEEEVEEVEEEEEEEEEPVVIVEAPKIRVRAAAKEEEPEKPPKAATPVPPVAPAKPPSPPPVVEAPRPAPPPPVVEAPRPAPPPPPSPSPAPPKPAEPSYPTTSRPYEPPKVTPIVRDDYPRKEPPPTKKPKQTKEDTNQQTRGLITKSDLIDLIPVVGSCKLAIETVQAAYNGDGKLAVRKAVQCGISLVADFYLGRAIARHGQVLANAVTEQTVVRFLNRAENQIIIVSTFKASNQLFNTLSRMLS